MKRYGWNFFRPSLRLSRFLSQESYIMRALFLVHVCKMVLSVGVFFIFLNFDFLGRWVARGEDKK